MINANFNYVTIEEEKAPVPKKVLIDKTLILKEIHRKKQIRLPKLKDGKTTRELETGNSAYVTCSVQNLCNKQL